MKSVMKHLFSQVPKAEIERSSFDRSAGYKTTFNAGMLVPFFVDEALPGDTFNVKMSAFARLATPIKPIMDNMFYETFFFSVPYRLVWDNWKKFNGEQDNPGDTTDYRVPQVVSPATTGWATESLADYMGIPVGVPDLSVSALPFRAYRLIFNEWFRDQNMVGSTPISKADGPDTTTDLATHIFRRGKRHDYFTSCLPWPQKHSDVLLPLGAKAPVHGIGKGDGTYGDLGVSYLETGGLTVPYTSAQVINAALGQPGAYAVVQDPDHPGFPGIYADLQAATSAKINAVREAFQLQRLFERDARGGTRYKEIIKAHFGVDHPDLNWRPEYLGGGSTNINIHPVAQTAPTGAYADTPIGEVSGYGTFSVSGHGFTKSFTEHCIIIGIMCVRADLTYQQGLDRMWSRQTRYDFYWPALSHIGEQPVKNKEIYAVGSAVAGQDDATFGYQERYAEYRYATSKITGKFKSNETGGTPLDMWHLSQDFANLPTLNQQFIEENPPIDRVVAVPSEPDFIFDSIIKMKCARPMPVYSVPGMIDHF